METTTDAFALGFALVMGAGCLLCFGLFMTFEYVRHFVRRYRQSGWYPDKVEQRFWPRVRWALAHFSPLIL